MTRRWRRQSGANSSLKGRNSLLAGKIQGNSSILLSEIRISDRKRDEDQRLTDEFPTQPNREIISPEQGIKSAHQGSPPPDQGNPAVLGDDVILILIQPII